ncbi:cysteine-rich receptor-like protein kinase 25 [Impatiens glandulifera]|uniref:cysteine-rich receptor-like protein kinase 25 n=1 Tax=Impatiens glandulifera TaxID=253017 RepID=UPI001FB1378D|nr:cysteine-rich receptor-like protein kinase 25 [Impatiens glandulifera]
MNAKIADFGMARLSVMDETQGNTRRIVGTYGYMAPEYAMHGNFSVKSDVFSFGVLVLEIVSGQRNNSFRNGENVEDLLSFAWKSWKEGTASNLIDPTVRGGRESISEIVRCIHIGLLCCQSKVADRPTMASVVLMLNSFSLTLALPSEPAFFNGVRTEYTTTSQEEDINFSNNDISLSQIVWIWIIIRIVLLLQLPITTFIRLARAAEPNYVNHFCVNTGNYTNASTYQTNLNNLLSSLPSIVDQYGFTNSTAGRDPDRVYALVLCRGDVDVDSCRSCTISSVSRLPAALCPGYKDAILWFDLCMLRYSSRSITGFISTGQHFFLVNPYNATSIVQFNYALMTFLTHLRTTAAAGGPLRKFAAGNTTGPDFQKLYALVQCTPDLSEQLCNDCLKRAMSEIPDCCDGKVGVRVFYPSCTLWSENYPFFDVIAVQALSPPPPPPSSVEAPSFISGSAEKQSNKNRTAIIGIAVSISILGILILIISTWLIFSKRRKQRRSIQNVKIDGMSTFETLQYTTDTIRAATNDFSDDNKLGQGGFGAVYKGKLANGQDVAVKRLCRGGGQGEEEFKNEIVLLANLQHRNLVRILGFCLQGTNMLLVYELFANSSLDRFLFDPVKRAQLDWRKRHKIITGVARGMLYLHEDSRLRIIHRDLKAGNVLLDAEMNAKISDFGMARLFARDETRGNTRRIAGTYGYMAPEYALHGQFSVKSDVFSFGLLILEIVCGKKNSQDNGDYVEHLLSNVWRSWRDGEGNEMSCDDIIDPIMLRDNRMDHTIMMMMKRCIHTGLLCCQENAENRPTMAGVVQMLNNLPLTSLPSPFKPGFYMHGGDDDHHGPNQNSQQYSNQEDSISHVYPR